AAVGHRAAVGPRGGAVSGRARGAAPLCAATVDVQPRADRADGAVGASVIGERALIAASGTTAADEQTGARDERTPKPTHSDSYSSDLRRRRGPSHWETDPGQFPLLPSIPRSRPKRTGGSRLTSLIGARA